MRLGGASEIVPSNNIYFILHISIQYNTIPKYIVAEILRQQWSSALRRRATCWCRPVSTFDRQHQQASEMRLPLSRKGWGLPKHPTNETWFTRLAVPRAHASQPQGITGQPRSPPNQTETSNQSTKALLSSSVAPASSLTRAGVSPTCFIASRHLHS